MSDFTGSVQKRWRSISVSFRVSPQESETINMLVKTAGMTKQNYCVQRLLQEDVVVHPNIRIQKYLRDYLVQLTEELKRLEKIDQSTDVLENIKYLLEFISKLSPSDENNHQTTIRRCCSKSGEERNA